MQFRKIEPFPNVSLAQWHDWKWQFKASLRSEADFLQHIELSASEATAFKSRERIFSIQVSPYYFSLIDKSQVNDPIRQMILPQSAEILSGGQQVPDPLGERKHSPHERVIHRYPDRVLFLVTDQCSLYCRYCLRKHFTGNDQAFIESKDYLAALNYLRAAKGVREVILSGGDPLTLADSRIDKILADLRQISHIEIVRIASRMPVVCPMRITDDLVHIFRKYKPVYFMTHFNHPAELTTDSAAAVEKLVDNGVPVFNQMVLLNGINNHAAIVAALSRRLVYLRAKPYYAFQCDPSEGTDHFRTSPEETKQIQRELWGRLSGLAMPAFSLDIPGGGGKVGIVPDFFKAKTEEGYLFSGWDGTEGLYQKPDFVSREPAGLEIYQDEWQQICNQRYGRTK